MNITALSVLFGISCLFVKFRAIGMFGVPWAI